MIARELLNNKKLEEISYFNGYSNFVNKMYSPKISQPEMTIVQTIDIGGPVDAYVNYFWELASIDRYAMSDTDECPIHASEMAANIAKISEKLWKRIDDETENTFYVAIYRDRQNDPLWFVVDNLSDVKVTDDYKVDRIYRFSGDTYEPDLYIVKPSHREEIETNYCESADMTYIMKTTYDGNQVTSIECIGWYCGEPNDNATEFYGSKGCLKAIYND